MRDRYDFGDSRTNPYIKAGGGKEEAGMGEGQGEAQADGEQRYEYGTDNCVKLDTLRPWRCQYAFLDVPEYKADGMLIDAEIPVKFGREWGFDGNKCIVIFCSFDKRYEQGFKEVMARLDRALAVTVDGYAAERRQFAEMIAKAGDKDKKGGKGEQG